MKVTTVGKGWFHLHVVLLSPATRERRQQCPLGGGLDLATSTLTLLTRNLRETYALNPVQEPIFWVCPCLHFGWTVLRDTAHSVS